MTCIIVPAKSIIYCTMTQHIATRKLLINCWKKLDIEGVLALLDDNITWNNSGGLKPPLAGKAELRADLERMAAAA